MLPPLNLHDNKGDLLSPKRVDGHRSSGSSSTRKQSLAKTLSDIPVLTEISKIPRDYFVIETNDVVVPHTYPLDQYRSTLTSQGQWETIVFPALTPHNRQQVLYLRQVLCKMRATIPRFNEDDTVLETKTCPSILTERRRLMIEHTSQETQIYSSCFHELARQIRYICREQSELLYEIRDQYDAAIARLLEHSKLLIQENNQQQDQITELHAQYERIVEEKKQLADKVQELEHQLKHCLPVAVVQVQGDRVIENGRDDCVDDNDSKSDADDDEVEWRKQRAEASGDSSRSKNDPTEELHSAATKLQSAYQKYQICKEQAQVVLRANKQAAALNIQRSYRGFRERRLALFRRAVMRTIMRQREKNAAVGLMQANVQAHLLSRRRGMRAKLSLMNSTSKLIGESEREQDGDALVSASQDLVPATEEGTTALNEKDDGNTASDMDSDTKETMERDTQSNLRQTLSQLLTTFRDLASGITMLHQGEGQSEQVVAAAENGDVPDDQRDVLSRFTDVTPLESLDEEDVKSIQETIQQAQALVASLHLVLRTVPEEKVKSDNAERSLDESNKRLNCDSAVQTDSVVDLNQHIQSDKHDKAQLVDAIDTTNLDGNMPTTSCEEQETVRLHNDAELHLDDSLWNSAAYYPATRKDMAETEARLALALSSREQRKRLVSLKQYISDIYDTIVGKLSELPSSRLGEMLATHCHLAVSFTEWRQQRSRLFSKVAIAEEPAQQLEVLGFNIEQLTYEHFRCRLGLPQLIDAAIADLTKSIEDFAAIDADVKRFQEFMLRERSEEELIFCSVCRYVCARHLRSDERPAGTASLSYRRQPMFHPITMREVIDLPHALELAKLLFRVDDEREIMESDMPLIETESVVYGQYLPTNGYHQFAAIVASFLVDPDSQAAAVSSINEGRSVGLKQNDSLVLGNTCRRPDGSPRHASTMVRATNYNQFHAKQYNSQAATSPVVRHEQQQRLSSRTKEPKWVFFEDVMTLLMRYRNEMKHFHLFAHYTQELFNRAATRNSSTSSDELTREGEQGLIQVKLLDDTTFIETLTPLSLGPTERELRNIFHNSLRQRKLQMFMPLRVFTSVVLQLLRNGLVSVSTYGPMQKPRPSTMDTEQRPLSIRQEKEEKEWRALALKWRAQEAVFEAAIEAIYHQAPSLSSSPSSDINGLTSSDDNRATCALQLLQLRQELYDLFTSRSRQGQELKRAYELYNILVNERLGSDASARDAPVGSGPSLESSALVYERHLDA